MKIGLNDKLLSKALTEGKGQLPFNFDFGKLTKTKADFILQNFFRKFSRRKCDKNEGKIEGPGDGNKQSCRTVARQSQALKLVRE